MKVRARIFGVLYSLLIAFFLAIIVNLAASSVGGRPITWESFGWNMLQGIVVGGLVGILLPIKKISDAFCAALGAESKLAKSLVTPIALATLFVIILNFYFTAVNTGFGTFMTEAGPITFTSRFMDNVHVIWAYIYVAAVLFDPVAFFLARKITGFPPAAKGRAQDVLQGSAAEEQPQGVLQGSATEAVVK